MDLVYDRCPYAFGRPPRHIAGTTAGVEEPRPSPADDGVEQGIGQLHAQRPEELVVGLGMQLPAGARYASVSINNLRGDDALTLDNTAFAVLVQRKPAQVLLVSAGNQFLEKVLTLLPNVDLYRIASQRYLAVEADRFDIIVFDNYLPPLLPRGNLLIVNPPDRGPYRSAGSVSRPRITSWDHEDPILSFVDLRDLNITRASKLSSKINGSTSSSP